MIKCLIIEDETAAQRILQSYLVQTPFAKLINTYESGIDVSPHDLDDIDLIFLDIELPVLSGLAFLKSIQHPPKIIITTAYPYYAVKAFELEVLDYLLKPFAYERFFKAITRVRHQLLLEGNTQMEEIFLYADKSFHRVATQDILYLKAEVDYVKVVLKYQSILILDSLRNWEEKLKPLGFLRIHRSYIINPKQIDRVFGNQVYINGQTLPIGKVYREGFFKRIEG
ncbi:MAG: LytTR family DNA-binding domain-containing protein [Bacteroidota bacterium]